MSHICVTVRLPLPHFPFRVTLCDTAEGSGEEWTAPDDILKGVILFGRPTPKILGTLKTIVMMNLMEGADVLSASLLQLLRMHYACNSAKASTASKAKNDQTDQKQTKEKPPKKQKKQRKGLGASPGHKESQISHSPSTNAF